MDDLAETVSERLDEVLELIEEIENDHPDTYVRGEDFFVDVREKATDMQEGVNSRGTATHKQLHAANNWKTGVSRWIRN